MNLRTGCLVTAALLLQGQAFAAPRACRTGEATPESMTWNFSKEGSRLLQDIRLEARDARMETAMLEVQARNPGVDWQTHAFELSAVRYDVNHMGEKLCRLETIRGQLAPDQQKAVDETARLTKEMAIFTQDAILFLNDHHDNLWNPVYRAYIHDVYQEAASVNHAAARTHEG